MNKNPLVSIVIPTFNRANLLKKTLKSIENQTYNNYEVIVVDDGSFDDSAKHVCSFFNKIKYLKISNSGSPAKPRNVGILNSKGKYIAFVDDDDLWLPKKLETQVAILEDNPNFGLVHGCCEVIDENDQLKNKIIGRPRNLNLKHGNVKLSMVGNWTVMMPTSFIRRDIVQSVGFFNESMSAAGEDTEFWTRCSFETNFYYHDEPLVYYRVHGNNISFNNNAYLLLPLHLKKVVNTQYKKKNITSKQYRKLMDNLIQLQLRTFKLNRLLTFKNIFVINLFWFLNYKNVICFFKFLVRK